MTTTRTLVCQKCKAQFKFDLDKITSDVVKFKCPRCASVQYIRKSSPPKDIASAPLPKQIKPGTAIDHASGGEKLPGYFIAEEKI